MSTLLEMRVKLRSRIGAPDPNSVTDAVLTDCLNTAYLQIANKYRFHMSRKLCIVKTIAGEFRYALPDNTSAVLRIKDITANHERKLKKLGDRRESEYDARTRTDSWGEPMSYARYRGWFELTPTPDGVYSLEVFYKFGVPELVNDSDVPVIPASWHHGIVLMGRQVYYDEVGNDFTKAAYASQSFDKWVAEQPTEIDEEMMADLDSGVSVPTLNFTQDPRVDFNHEEP
jgi:hypothetical protein